MNPSRQIRDATRAVSVLDLPKGTPGRYGRGGGSSVKRSVFRTRDTLKRGVVFIRTRGVLKRGVVFIRTRGALKRGVFIRTTTRGVLKRGVWLQWNRKAVQGRARGWKRRSDVLRSDIVSDAFAKLEYDAMDMVQGSVIV